MKNLNSFPSFPLIDILLSVPATAKAMNSSDVSMGNAWDYATYESHNGGALISLQLVHSYLKSNG